ncbi:MAG TPA: sigma-70 family RNA polymerase sigma factor [Bacteroidales bacterium]|nr:sigma-70 family RNA polymerase sigma factor [Bacteroidales bacterium]HQI70214.1 sigma-70 family RNA polymerase sigma factor [Bacteroidales bacterium]
MHLVPDKEIMHLISNQESRHQGFDMLVRAYSEKTYRLIRRIVITHEDSDDVVQNVFIKIWNNIDNFRADAQLSTWIYRIAVNEALIFLKHKKIFFFIPYYHVEKKLSNSLKDDNFFKADEIETKLQKAILSLPTRQRLVFNLRYYEELSFEEISKILNTSPGALKASYHFAYQKIKKNLAIL